MDDYKNVTISHFTGLFNKFGDNIKSLDWGSEKGQQLRFSILQEIIINDDCSILDIGCGKGDFYDFLSKNRKIKKFTGIDLNEKIIELASKKEVTDLVEFEVRDIISDPFQTKFDYVFASGIFYLKINDNEKYFEDMLLRMLSHALKGIAFNMLSSSIEEKEEHEYYFNPSWVVSKLENLGLKYVLRNDYKPNDFTVYIYL